MCPLSEELYHMLLQAFFYNTTWGHRRRNCSPKVEFFPWVLGFLLEFWVFSLSFKFLTQYLSSILKKIIANFQFFLQNLPILKTFVNKNGIKSLTPPEKFSFSTKSFQIEVFFLSFWKRETLLPKGWVFFLSFWLEFVPWVLVFSGSGVKKKSLI